ncbi:MAG: replication-relaxation family protein [Dehalococcoidales bacterium]|nr:replication-relaxation family protein [Dehalococcoidales bacterium]
MTNPAEGLQRLRGQMVRRSPTKTELAKRTPIVLTDRDKNILTAIYTHGFLTTELIGLAFFPDPPEGRSSPCSRVYERLQQLWKWSFVERVEPPIPRSTGGRRPYLYALGRRGESVVAQQLGQSAAPVHMRRVDRLDSLFLDHELRIAAFWANLVALLRSSRARLGRWLPERELRARKVRVQDPHTGWWLQVLPDAAFEVVYPDGFVQGCLLEVDMGTLTLARIRRKLRAFELYLAQGLAAKHWEDDFEVFVLTHSRPRLQQLWRATQGEIPRERWDSYSFATFDALDSRKFQSARWERDRSPSVRCRIPCRGIRTG